MLLIESEWKLCGSLIISCPDPLAFLDLNSLLNAHLAFLPLHKNVFSSDCAVRKKELDTGMGRVLSR